MESISHYRLSNQKPIAAQKKNSEKETSFAQKMRNIFKKIAFEIPLPAVAPKKGYL